MRQLLVTMLVLFVAACSGESKYADAKPAAVAEETKVAATLIYAEWCGSCKVLDPKIKAVKATGAIPGIEHVVLDYTARDNDAFFAAADTAGIGEAVRTRFAGSVKTGLLLVINVETGEIIQEITKEMTEDQIAAALKSAVSA